jgi:hypothetical protein
VFERFTERARQVVVLAQDEARALKHNYIGTEHILLGLLREEEGLAARVLESLDITVEEVRAQVARIVGQGDEVTTGQIPFTPRAKKVLELALREAQSLAHNHIGTEHILLGLVRENEGVAARILLDFDADAETVRDHVIQMLGGPPVMGRKAFVLASPPLAREYLDELARVREEKEAALATQELERAAALQDRERILVSAARQLARAWDERVPTPRAAGPEDHEYRPTSPPLDPGFADALQSIRRVKQDAMSRDDTDAVVESVKRERALISAARDVERAWEGRNEPAPTFSAGRRLRPRRVPPVRPRQPPRPVSGYEPWSPARWMIVGWLLFAGALGLGILVGWLIWG